MNVRWRRRAKPNDPLRDLAVSLGIGQFKRTRCNAEPEEAARTAHEPFDRLKEVRARNDFFCCALLDDNEGVVNGRVAKPVGCAADWALRIVGGYALARALAHRTRA
jgi:hypothetical protein